MRYAEVWRHRAAQIRPIRVLMERVLHMRIAGHLEQACTRDCESMRYAVVWRHRAAQIRPIRVLMERVLHTRIAGYLQQAC